MQTKLHEESNNNNNNNNNITNTSSQSYAQPLQPATSYGFTLTPSTDHEISASDNGVQSGLASNSQHLASSSESPVSTSAPTPTSKRKFEVDSISSFYENCADVRCFLNELMPEMCDFITKPYNITSTTPDHNRNSSDDALVIRFKTIVPKADRQKINEFFMKVALQDYSFMCELCDSKQYITENYNPDGWYQLSVNGVSYGFVLSGKSLTILANNLKELKEAGTDLSEYKLSISNLPPAASTLQGTNNLGYTPFSYNAPVSPPTMFNQSQQLPYSQNTPSFWNAPGGQSPAPMQTQHTPNIFPGNFNAAFRPR